MSRERALSTAEEQTFFQRKLLKAKTAVVKSSTPLEGTEVSRSLAV